MAAYGVSVLRQQIDARADPWLQSPLSEVAASPFRRDPL
jgi:hypothetical protein